MKKQLYSKENIAKERAQKAEIKLALKKERDAIKQARQKAREKMQESFRAAQKQAQRDMEKYWDGEDPTPFNPNKTYFRESSDDLKLALLISMVSDNY